MSGPAVRDWPFTEIPATIERPEDWEKAWTTGIRKRRRVRAKVTEDVVEKVTKKTTKKATKKTTRKVKKK